MAKCPKCKAKVGNPTKAWKYGVFHVNMYNCDCGNQFREYFHERKLRFVLSAHDGTLPTGQRERTKNTR